MIAARVVGAAVAPTPCLFADMANRIDVREGVRKRGIHIPTDTWFCGCAARHRR